MSRAVDAARAHVGAPDAAPTSWRVVSRVDAGAPYLLVGISTDITGWIVAVDLDGNLMSRGQDPTGAGAWWVDVPEDLVWDPNVGHSLLYPLRRSDRGLLDHNGEPVSRRTSRGG